jgi:hypothetical protein
MSPRRPARDDEVPEADRLEQAMPAGGGEVLDDAESRDPFDIEAGATPRVGDLPADVPEDDALEQAMPAHGGDDWDERTPA